MAKPKSTTSKQGKSKRTASFEGVYLLKMVLYLLLGSVWVKATNGDSIEIGIPIGLIIGLAFTLHEHFRIDRKLEYVVLLAAMLFGYFAPYGLYINF